MTRIEGFPTQAAVSVPATATTPQATPATPAVAGTLAQADAAPPGGFTQAYVNALNAKKAELSRQLTSAQSRRNDVARDLRNAPDGPARTGLEGRLAVLDTRLAQLETDIAANGRQLASAPGNMLANALSSTTAPRNFSTGVFSPGQLTGVSIVFTLAVLMPIALAFARNIVRRGSRPQPAPQILESGARLERMEQAVDAIAVEIERISEGQRFVTSLLAKRGDAAPVLSNQQDERPLMAAGSSPASSRDSR
jgi:hypothetical protein